MTIVVEMWVEPMDQFERTLACQGEFVLVALDAQRQPTPVPALPTELVGGDDGVTRATA
jgi:acyl-CoA hydrolase